MTCTFLEEDTGREGHGDRQSLKEVVMMALTDWQERFLPAASSRLNGSCATSLGSRAKATYNSQCRTVGVKWPTIGQPRPRDRANCVITNALWP